MLRPLLSLAILMFPAALPAEENAPSAMTFEAHIRPIVKAHCWQCHGEEEELKGGLDARLARSLIKGGDSGPVIVPGKHGESLLYERVAAGEMPPGKKKLPARDVELIARWIDGGARTARAEPENLAVGDTFTDEERAHWSFQPIRRTLPPLVRNSDSVHSPIDAFLLAKLESKGLSYSHEADRATLIRRLSFDLTGLPPAPEAVDRFIQDTAPDAWERLVEELLASPAYGERWARHWLDAAGYADS